MLGKKVVGALVAGTAAAVVSTAGVAYAVTTYRTGSATDKQYIATSNDPFVAPTATGWSTVPGTQVTVPITGRRHMISARFTAESDCVGTGSCAVRIVYTGGGTGATELAPQTGVDFAFDADDGGTASARSMERTTATYLPVGTYKVSVQVRRVGGATSFTLDDYHLNVGTIAPAN